MITNFVTHNIFTSFFKLTRTVFIGSFIASLTWLSATDAAANLIIVKAVYGDLSDPNGTADVTANIAALVKDDRVSVEANDDSLGDPAPGIHKLLKVDYEVDGIPGSKTVPEDSTLTISDNDKPETWNPMTSSSKLIIRWAEYGDLPGGDAKDVTAVLAALIQGDSLDVIVTNAIFGDPAPELSK